MTVLSGRGKMSSVDIMIDESTLKELVCDHLSKVIGAVIEEADVKIEVKSKHNYRSEWETAAFRATIHKSI
jgi:hypothetical protein